MSELVSREWRFYIDDMIAFTEKVVAYTNGLDQQAFVASGLVHLPMARVRVPGLVKSRGIPRSSRDEGTEVSSWQRDTTLSCVVTC